MTSTQPVLFPQCIFLLLQFSSPQAQDKLLPSLRLPGKQATAGNPFAPGGSPSTFLQLQGEAGRKGCSARFVPPPRVRRPGNGDADSGRAVSE